MTVRPTASSIMLRNAGAWLVVFLLVQIHQFIIHHRFLNKPTGSSAATAAHANFFWFLSSVKDRQRSIRNATAPARFLMGIFSIAADVERRNLIRRALQVYHDSPICAFSSSHGITLMSDSKTVKSVEDCEIMYTFVIGANPRGSKQILRTINATDSHRHPEVASRRLVTQPPPEWNLTAEPKDITFLNIQENMNEGKSPTWFYYASQVLKEHDWDYAIKCDSDTGVRMDVFLHSNLPRAAKRIYAGRFAPSRNQRGRIYLQGQFYVLSRDVSELVSHEAIIGEPPSSSTLLLPKYPFIQPKRKLRSLNASKLQRRRAPPQPEYVDEDAVIGRLVMKHIPSVHLIVTSDMQTLKSPKLMPWDHDMKSLEIYERFIINEAKRKAHEKVKRRKRKKRKQ